MNEHEGTWEWNGVRMTEEEWSEQLLRYSEQQWRPVQLHPVNETNDPTLAARAQ